VRPLLLVALTACNSAGFKNGPVGDPGPETCYESDCAPPQGPGTSMDGGRDGDADADAADAGG